MTKQLHLFYSGRVQGIGFRYAVLGIAGQQKICGWVKNLDDGRVEIIAEASEDILSNFVQEINHKFSGYIKDLNTEWLPACRQDGEFRDFGIRF
jgi:acylphosphatase